VCRVGAAVIALSVDGEAVIDGMPPGPCRPELYRGVVLAPWPNRTEPTYTFEGRRLQLPVNEPETGAALHGLVFDRTWGVVDGASDSVTLETVLGDDPGYPFPVVLRARYTLRRDGLAAEISANNQGPGRAPVGLGAHPYLSAGAAVDDTTLQVPASEVLVLGPRGVPSAPPLQVAGTPLDYRAGRLIGSGQLDHAYASPLPDDDGAIRVHLRGGRRVALETDATVRCLMVFTSDTLEPPARRAAIAVEPMNCPPGALTTGEGLAVLEQDESVTLRWSVRAGKL
jgi:aldose 1-epimerase